MSFISRSIILSHLCVRLSAQAALAKKENGHTSYASLSFQLVCLESGG